MNAQGAPATTRRRRCQHDSIRVDGWLDAHCLRCGEDGYWEDGQRVASVDIHPSGKVLVRREEALLPEPDSQDTPKPVSRFRKLLRAFLGADSRG